MPQSTRRTVKSQNGGRWKRIRSNSSKSSTGKRVKRSAPSTLVGNLASLENQNGGDRGKRARSNSRKSSAKRVKRSAPSTLVGNLASLEN